MDVVVVESPAKAKTINKYLGKGYTVLASYGHVRDLPPKEGSVRPDEDFAISWEVDGKANKRLQDIIKAVKGAEHLYLATDPDREGEAISWHVREILNQRHALKGVDVKRVVFNEVTKSAVQEAFKHPRELDNELVDAYLARRALDYLVGFTLSPVLWRKLPGSRSAGRVQSVALRLICEREAEIEIFKPREYWSIEAEFTTPAGDKFTARLTHLDGKRLDRFDLANEETARAAADKIARQAGFSVREIERKQIRRNPPPPFTTSTLQQEASRKLGMTASRTMRIAQRLYEGVDIDGETVGLITYMRTDGVALSNEAIAAVRDMISQEYGADYRPAEARIYRTQAKNAQEAHEAIRPTDMFRRPNDVTRYLDDEQRRLYELIWKRAVASQMATALIDQVGVDITSPAGDVILRATGSTVAFDGYLKLYSEDVDDLDDDEDNRRLPPLKERDALERGEIKPEQHFTQPPPRYTEASLVKKMEELGIGRPSTYASIIQVLQDRNYVRLDKKRFLPEDRGRLVTAFLSEFFKRYVEYDFTADLENQLDDVSGGRVAWKKVLEDFWRDFSAAIGGTKDLKITDVINALDETLGQHFFPAPEDGKDPRVCPVCGAGRLGLKLGRFGAFIGCSNYPECKFTRPLGIDGDGAESSSPRELGLDPETKVPITLKKGPYGFYVQRGEGNPDEKPKRASIPKAIPLADVDLDKAVRLLALPRELGPHPENGEMITAAIGRFGPYLKHGKEFRSLPKDDDVLTIGLNRAVSLLAEPKQQRRGAPTPIKSLGPHPSDGAPVNLFSGRYGPYVAHGGVNATLRDTSPDEVTLQQAIDLLAARPQPKGKAKRAAPKAKKAAAPKEPKSAFAAPAEAPQSTDGKKTTPKPKAVKKAAASQKSGADKSGAQKSAKKPAPKRQPPRRSEHRDRPRYGTLRQGELPEIGVIEIASIDIDGELHARPIIGQREYREDVIVIAEPGAPTLGLGERGIARFARRDSGGWEARIIRALDHTPDRVVGVYRGSSHGGRIEPTDRRERREFRVALEDSKEARDGELVLAQLKRDGGFGLPEARIVERLGDSSNPRAFSLIAIHTHGIPTDFSVEAIAIAEAAQPVTLGKRTDLRDIPLVTIDGSDARDFDDAVWAEPDPEQDGGWHAIVAIADVAWYVRQGSALDRDAQSRGNSVYFPDRVVPMLPEALSNELCSLKPKVERACMAVHLWFDAGGHLQRHRFVRGLMRSAARFTYEEVQQAIDGAPSDQAGPLLDPVLRPLYGAFAALDKARRQRGALDLDLPERRIQLDADGKVARIEPRARLDSHKLIEEFMIAANVAAAETLERLQKPCLYRIHDAPDPMKLNALSEFLADIGLPGVKLAKGQVVRPRHFNAILEKVAGTPFATLVPQLVLRSQAQAVYAPTNIGHFGLGLRHYAHFTSPIRRYADLVVHRSLIDALSLGADDERGPGDDLVELGEHVSMTERRAAAAERNAADRYIAAYLADRVGAEFAGRVNGVTRAGLFVTLADTGADGLIPIRSLPEDYYDHDEARHRLVGRRHRRIYTLGEHVTVRLAEANTTTGSLRFDLIADNMPQDRKRLGQVKKRLKTKRR